MSEYDPKSEGFSKAGSIYPGDIDHYVPLPTGNASSLLELSSDYLFFTPGLMHLLIPELPDLIAGYTDETNIPLTVYKYSSDNTIFKGLAHQGVNHDWENTLLAVSREKAQYIGWVACSSFVRGTHLFRLKIQDMTIIDPLEWDRGDRLTRPSLLPVTAFVIDSTVGCIYFEEEIVDGIPVSYTVTRRDTVLPETATLRDALFRGESNPYRDIDKGDSNAH